MIERLAGWLAPVAMPPGERLGFCLAGMRSAFTRDLLLLRMRRQPVLLGTGLPPLPAMVTDGRLDVDVGALLAMNAVVRDRAIEAPLAFIEAIKLADNADRIAARRLMQCGDRAALVAAIDANGQMQALGALRFAVMPVLRARLGADAEGQLRAEGPSMWRQLRVRELALARGMARPGFERALAGFLTHHAWLHGEDVEIVETGSREAVLARLAALDAETELAALRANPPQPPPPTVDPHILLGRAIAWHDDANRRGKMRLLHALVTLAQQLGLPPATTRLLELAHGLPECA